MRFDEDLEQRLPLKFRIDSAVIQVFRYTLKEMETLPAHDLRLRQTADQTAIPHARP